MEMQGSFRMVWHGTVKVVPFILCAMVMAVPGQGDFTMNALAPRIVHGLK